MRRIALFALLAATIACAPPAPAANAPDDIAAVNALRDKVMRTYGAGDATAVGNLYTTDAVSAQNHQPTETGRDAIVKGLGGLFSAYNVKLALTAQDTWTMGDHGYDFGTFTFTLTPKDAATPAPPMDEGHYLVILKKDSDGQWRVSRDVGNSSLPMPTMPMPATTKKDGK